MRSLLPLALAVLATAVGASAHSLNWVQYINPTDGYDFAFGVCLFGDYLAVLGTAHDDEFVALLDRATGKVVKTWVGEYGWPINCLSVGDRLYVVGSNEIYTFDMGLNVVKKVELNWFPKAISFDGSYLYLAGNIREDVDSDRRHDEVWRIEKRTLDLGLVAYREFYREWDKAYGYVSYVHDIAVNPVTGELWVVGEWYLVNETIEYWIPDTHHSFLAIFDSRLSIKKVVEYPVSHKYYIGELLSVCFDDYGDAYVAGDSGVAKFDKYGNILAVSKDAWGKIACVGDRVYVFDGGHILYLFDKGLNPLGELNLNKDVKAYPHFWFGKSAFDGRNLYVAGHGYILELNQTTIIVYSIPVTSTTLITTQTTHPLSTTPTATTRQPTAPTPTPTPASLPTLQSQPAGFPVEAVTLIVVAAVAGVLAVARLRGRGAEARRAQPTTQTVTRPHVGEGNVVGDFCLEYPGGVIPLAEYTVVGRGDFSGLPGQVLAMIEERHFAVYYRDGVWWVEDLGSRHGTYLNGVRVKRERLREGDVISPGAAVAAMFKRCETTRRVVPMEEEGTKTY